MSSQQKIRNVAAARMSSKGDLFPPDISTKENSLLYVERLLAVSVSSIAFLRNVFDEKCFSLRKWCDYQLQLLNGIDKKSKFVINCLTGAFDALKKTYLREIILGIASNPKNPDDVVEAYTFKFNYSKDGDASVAIAARTRSTSLQPDQMETTYEQVNNSMQLLIRHLMTYVETLDALPKNSFFTLKLLYYDERTPTDYEPPGFEPSESLDFKFVVEKNPKPVVYGVVDTKHHSVKASVRSVLMKKNKSKGNGNVPNVVELSEKKKNDNQVKNKNQNDSSIVQSKRTEIRTKNNAEINTIERMIDEERDNPKTTSHCSIPVNTSVTKSSESNVGGAKKRSIYDFIDEDDDEENFDRRKRFYG